MDNCWIYLYNQASEAGNELKEALGIPRINHTRSRFRGDRTKTVINWGSSDLPASVRACRVVNNQAAVETSINKLKFFRATYNLCRTVPWSSCRWEAAKWLLEGSKVVCRDRLEGREGVGIRLVCPPDCLGGPLAAIQEWVARVVPRDSNARLRASYEVLGPSKLYTKFIPSTAEYRVHVVGGRCIAVHRKTGGTDATVRNTGNGWLFRRVSDYPRSVVEEALRAVGALGLDFAAVDVLWDGVLAWVLETNTAPGIDGMEWTKRQYATALERLVNEMLHMQ